MNVKVLVAFHAKSPEQLDPICMKYPDVFVPIYCGAAIQPPKTEFLQSMLQDNVGINISRHNKQLCEFTAMYWMYKHQDLLGHPDMIGLCHYRRYFDTDYTKLDPNVIYARRAPQGTLNTLYTYLNAYIGVDIFQMILDMFRYYLPEYRDTIEFCLTDMRFYDKNMAIMSAFQYSHYMEYMLQVVRLLYSDEIAKIVQELGRTDKKYADIFFNGRGKAWILEVSSTFYLEHCRAYGAKIQLLQPTIGSFNAY